MNATCKSTYATGSPGLVVMGDEPRSRGQGFESQHRVDIFHIDLM